MLLSLSGFLFEDGTSQSIKFEPFCKLASNAGYNGVELRNSQIRMEDSKLKRSEIKNIHLGSKTIKIRGVQMKKGIISILIVVDFPAPLGPMKPKISPASTSRVRFLTPKIFP